MCAQRRLKSACASAQSDQSLRCSHEETLNPCLSKMRPVKILIRLRESAGWSESSVYAHVRRYGMISIRSGPDFIQGLILKITRINIKRIKTAGFRRANILRYGRWDFNHSGTPFYAPPQTWRGIMLYRPKFWVSVRPSIGPFVYQRFIISCPLHNSETVWDIFTKLHTNVNH